MASIRSDRQLKSRQQTIRHTLLVILLHHRQNRLKLQASFGMDDVAGDDAFDEVTI